jgi:three-Cys-motif partner protein
MKKTSCENRYDALSPAAPCVAEARQAFGGDWTEVKLAMLSDYLEAYTTALKKFPFSKVYIDAFAGTGYREISAQSDSLDLFAKQAEAEYADFLDGSARLALKIKTPFDRYVFIEQSCRRLDDLRASLPSDFPEMAKRMDFQPGDANVLLPDICRQTDWRTTRAVLFLDPFGMNVDWSTMEAVARTQAIDVWILFPVGVGVNRLLMKDPTKIPQAWKDRLDRLFGTPAWVDAFYRTQSQLTLFGDEETTTKVPDAISAIVAFYQQRLKTIFAKVADYPTFLYNSKRSPMFIFTFATGSPNPKAQALALKIAGHILGKRR